MKKTETNKNLTKGYNSYLHITFEGSTWHGVQTFLSQLKKKYSSVKCRTFQVEAGEYFMSFDEVIERLEQEGSFSEICVEDINAEIPKLEVNLHKGEGGTPFVNISYLTQNLRMSQNEMMEVLPIFEAWKDELEATKFYVRYENAMWEIGDDRAESGVIFSSDTLMGEQNR